MRSVFPLTIGILLTTIGVGMLAAGREPSEEVAACLVFGALFGALGVASLVKRYGMIFGKGQSMRPARFLAITGIFVMVSIAWVLLGGTVWHRTEQLDERLSSEMESLWGPQVLAQAAPYRAAQARASRGDAGSAAPSASDIQADIRHEHRYKGLLWYSTFTVDFQARYIVPASADGTPGVFIFPLPEGVTGYDGIEVALDGTGKQVAADEIEARRIVLSLPEDNAEHTVTVKYVTRGRDVWLYSPGEIPTETGPHGDQLDKVFTSSGPLSRIGSFLLAVTTNFSDIDYPKGTVSPNAPAAGADGGKQTVWTYDSSALSNKAMGIVMPQKQNAGPIVARMSFFAPVSLLFFLAVLLTIVMLKRIRLHPMHYLFVAAGFFAFHILLAYLADIVNIHVAFWICAAVSVVLVVSYMRLVGGVKFAV